MKKLIVCGDSFMSPRLHVKGTHFAEIFAESFNFELNVYARSAMSNGGIALQILHAIKQKPDLILFNTTQSDRIEFPNDPNYNYGHLIDVTDIQYLNYGNDEYSVQQQMFDGNIYSDNLVSLLSNPDFFAKKYNLSKDKFKAIEIYFKELYIENLKWQQDCMMMYCILHQLHLSNIPYIWCHDFLNVYEAYPMDWIETKNQTLKKFHEYRSISAPDGYKDPGYHTSPETQKLLADYIIEHYNKYFKPVV